MKNGALFVMILLALTLSQCKKADITGISNLNRDEIGVIGHGGMGISSAHTLDSYESLSKALSLGADGIEIDIQMTSDNHLVAFHNNTLDDNTTCVGAINDITFAELKKCKYLNGVLGTTQIYSLDLQGAFSAFDQITVVFDCKLVTKQDNQIFINEFANQLVSYIEFESSVLNRNFLIESQSIEFLQILKSLQPEYKLFFYPQSYEEGLAVALNNNLYGITIASSNITKEQVKEAHDNGLRVAIWNIDSRGDNVGAINKYPDYIQTDRLKGLLRLLK